MLRILLRYIVSQEERISKASGTTRWLNWVTPGRRSPSLHERDPPAYIPALRQSLHHSWQGFCQVVIDHHDREQNQEHECGLVDALFDLQADVAPHDAFDEEQ